ncbi:MAG: type II toxin-antitoxin system PemK/MazF family toxin [Thermodesulfobacteriota bacterium]
MTYPQRGDLFWVNLDPTVGAEIRKSRPCVIISPDAANRAGPLVIVAPVTTLKDGRTHFHELVLPKGAGNLPVESKIKVFQLRCIDKKRLGKAKIGSLSPNIVKQLDEKIRIVTGLY